MKNINYIKPTLSIKTLQSLKGQLLDIHVLMEDLNSFRVEEFLIFTRTNSHIFRQRFEILPVPLETVLNVGNIKLGRFLKLYALFCLTRNSSFIILGHIIIFELIHFCC